MPVAPAKTLIINKFVQIKWKSDRVEVDLIASKFTLSCLKQINREKHTTLLMDFNEALEKDASNKTLKNHVQFRGKIMYPTKSILWHQNWGFVEIKGR